MSDDTTPAGQTGGLRAAGESIGRGLDLAFQPLARPADVWATAAGRRADLRTDAARAALRAAETGHLDAVRNLRRDRKAFEKARAEVQWWNVFNGERRAARTVVRGSSQLAGDARRARRDARKAYPMPLPDLAVRCHIAHLVPTTVWAAFSDSFASTGAVTLSASAVALNVATVAAAAWRGRRTASTVADNSSQPLQPSQEEADLLQRLDPQTWSAVAEPRGLDDVVTAGATLTDSGIQVKLTLNGTLDLTALRKREAQLRAALRLREGTRLELREGKTGGHARMTLRTRSAADSLDLTGWKPGDAWAVDTVTGETVPVPLGKRIMFAGTSGSGKSWSARPLMAEASERDDHRLVIFDRKYIEARNWEHRARTATELDEMRELCDELEAEGEQRMQSIPRGKDTVDISPSCPRITVFVDEGGELISDSKTKHPKDEEDRSDYGDIMTRMRTIARKYRAAEIILVWCTQKPSLSGEGHGLDSQIAGQMMMRLSLALATSADSRVVFGDDADQKGWTAHELPMPGFALFRDQELGSKAVPHMLKMRAMSPKDVIGLPDRPIWSRSTGRATSADVAARKSLEAAAPAAGATVGDPWAELLPASAPAGDNPTVILGSDIASASSGPTLRQPVKSSDRDDQIMAALRAQPCVRLPDLARVLGLHKPTVKRSLDRLANDGLVVRDADGCWAPSDGC